MTTMTTSRRRVRVTGIVQGVGFRPFVYAVATELGLAGFVRNQASHVDIELEGDPCVLERFEKRLVSSAPPLAQIDEMCSTPIPLRREPGFHIKRSTDAGRDVASSAIPPDAATCDTCLTELFDPANRRYRHPFITCTDCGPRYTIIHTLPYDRPGTTMAGFEMCAWCRHEYQTPDDRRHHAQPISCHRCGPRLHYESSDGAVECETEPVLTRVQHDLATGRTVAIKGIGGYHLAVDATNNRAVARLRRRKARPDKPFAVMVADVGGAEEIAHVGPVERDALRSASAPIVLMKARIGTGVSTQVAPPGGLIGVMLAHAPLHHLLFQPSVVGDSRPPNILVMTSGNVTGAPICHTDTEARSHLRAVADSFCMHDRPIRVGCDDSVVRVIGGEVVPIRRSRGMVPNPIRVEPEIRPTAGVGADLKNTIALGSGHRVWVSHHLGDISTLESIEALEQAQTHLRNLTGLRPEDTGVDVHPGYRTRAWAIEHEGIDQVTNIQHHHAHLASLMAEHQLDDSHRVLGFVFDGTGYGTDATSWGGEVLLGGFAAVERATWLRPVRLPGGDVAARNPYKSALAHLLAAGIDWSTDLAPVRAASPTELALLRRQLTNGLRCTTSSSMGRLFDAVASLLDLGHSVTYEGQAPMALEALAGTAATSVDLPTLRMDAAGQLDPGPLLRALVESTRANGDAAALAFGLHSAIATSIVATTTTIADRLTIEDSGGFDAVGLTGGVFQNALLSRLAADALRKAGFEVLTHRLVPPNDGGIALGQLMIAADRHDPEESTNQCV